MTFTILTLFPKVLKEAINFSILKRAIDQGIITVNFVDIRDFAKDQYKSVDDHPYGGGVGMLMRVDILARAIIACRRNIKKEKVFLLDPKGDRYIEKTAQKLSKLEHIILVCGHYEGVDERLKYYIDGKISIGDYVLTGGEYPSLIVLDSITRLLPKVLKNKKATRVESFSTDTLEHPQFTRPENFDNHKVPSVLLSGNHKLIESWQKQMARKVSEVKINKRRDRI